MKKASFFFMCIMILAACSARPSLSNTPTIKLEVVKTTTSIPTIIPSSTLTPISTQEKPISPTPEEEETRTPDTTAHDELMTVWRPVFQGTIILFSTCQVMFDTHSWFQENQIDLTEAKAQLAAESDFIEIVQRGTLEWLPTDEVATYKARLDRNLDTLIELWGRMDNGDIGSQEITDPLFETCSSLGALQQEIVDMAIGAGLAIGEIDALGAEVDDIVQDIFDIMLES